MKFLIMYLTYMFLCFTVSHIFKIKFYKSFTLMTVALIYVPIIAVVILVLK